MNPRVDCPSVDRSASRTMGHVKAIPLNLFGVPFGLAGLAEAWLVLAGQHHAPALVGEIVLLVSAVSRLVGTTASALVVARRPSSWSAFSGDLLHPVAAPFASLAVI